MAVCGDRIISIVGWHCWPSDIGTFIVLAYCVWMPFEIHIRHPSNAGDPVTLSAVVKQTNPNLGAAPVVPTGNVQFMDGGTSIGAGTLDAGGTATLTTPFAAVTAPAIGHTLTAVYSGDSANLGATSTPLTQLVSALAPIS